MVIVEVFFIWVTGRIISSNQSQADMMLEVQQQYR